MKFAVKSAVKFVVKFVAKTSGEVCREVLLPKLHVKFVGKFWSKGFPEKSGSGLKPSFCKGNRMFLHWVLDPEFWGVFDTNIKQKLHTNFTANFTAHFTHNFTRNFTKNSYAKFHVSDVREPPRS